MVGQILHFQSQNLYTQSYRIVPVSWIWSSNTSCRPLLWLTNKYRKRTPHHTCKPPSSKVEQYTHHYHVLIHCFNQNALHKHSHLWVRFWANFNRLKALHLHYCQKKEYFWERFLTTLKCMARVTRSSMWLSLQCLHSLLQSSPCAIRRKIIFSPSQFCPLSPVRISLGLGLLFHRYAKNIFGKDHPCLHLPLLVKRRRLP